MYIKSYRADRFAGIKDVKLEFIDGLNIILGPNESGKSTIVNGMYSALFKNIDIKRNNNKDLEFSYKFMPRTEGDTIDSSLILGTEDGDYSIKRQWGEDKSIKLRTPEDTIIRSSKAVEEILKEILIFGETTYNNIVFAKQEDLKSILGNILEDSSFKREIGDLLRRALMELDGVSVDTIEENIKAELDALYGRWDIEKNYPQNNRGVHDQYVNGLGSVIKSYYRKEELKILMEKANRTEKEFEEVSKDINEINLLRDDYTFEKNKLEDLEDDINKRSILQLEIKTLEKELNKLMDIVKKWPAMETEVINMEQEKKKIDATKKKIEVDKLNIWKMNKKVELETKLRKLEEIESEIEEREKELKIIPNIEKKDIEELEELNIEIMTCKVNLNAGELVAKVNRKNIEMYIIKDFGEREKFIDGAKFKAENSIKIGSDDFELEIKIGDRDFEKIHKELESFKERKKNKFKNLKVESVEAAKLNLEKIETEQRRINSLKSEIKRVLAEDNIDIIKEELKNLEEIRVDKSEQELSEESDKLREREIAFLSDKNLKTSKLKEWVDEYTDFQNIFNIVGETSLEVTNKKSELETLKTLPARFNSTEEFKDRLNFLKTQLEEIDDKRSKLGEKYFEMKNNLLEDSYEELKMQHMESEKEYSRYLKRGESLLKIKEAFERTKDKMVSNPMEPLVEEFSKILGTITDGKYSNGIIEESFQINLENDGRIIPFDLLSAGTYDSVSLALRFSLLKYLFDGEKGFLILDDPLVDLDPKRKDESIALIKEFSKDYQIIFTTCSPKTATELDGNIIRL